MWEEVIKRIREEVKKGRELSYKEGEIGITSLLSCPIKTELRRKHPEIEASAVEIDDGYLWETQVKSVLREMFGERLEEEKELADEVEGVMIRGHLDCCIDLGDRIIGIELKSPKAILLKKIPEDQDGVFLMDENGEYVLHNPLYFTQAQVQKHILKKMYPDKEVQQFLFYKGPVRRGNFEKKLYILALVKEDITEEEYRELVRRFKEDRSPRYPNECTAYCEFYRAGVCRGVEFPYTDGGIDQETKELLREYRKLQSQLKNIESMLKRKIRGAVKLGGREIGWTLKKTIKLKEDRVAFLLPPERIPEFFAVRWNKKEDLIREFGNEIIEEVREERVWKL